MSPAIPHLSGRRIHSLPVSHSLPASLQTAASVATRPNLSSGSVAIGCPAVAATADFTALRGHGRPAAPAGPSQHARERAPSIR